MAIVLLVPSVISAIRVLPCLNNPLALVVLSRYGVAGLEPSPPTPIGLMSVYTVGP